MRVQCSGCREHIPLNNLVSSLRCHRCGELNQLDGEFWREHLVESSGAVRMIVPGRQRGRACEVESSDTAACPECDATFDVASLAASTSSTTCRQGHAIAVWPADPIALAAFPGARFVVAEPPATVAPTPGATLTVLACAGCGAPLDTDGSTRVITCAHCDATNVMSDAMSPKSRVFCIVVEDGRRERTEEDRHWDLAMTTGSPEKLRALACDPSPRVRKAVADGPRTPPDVLAILIEDPDPVVRKAALGNRNLPRPPVPEPIVEPPAKKRGFFAKLFGRGD